MDFAAICRICLVNNVRMHTVNSRQLQEIYERLTNIPFDTERRPLLACYFCYTHLKKCYQFKLRCLQSEEIFINTINGNFEIKSNESPAYSQTPVQQINITEECRDNTVQEFSNVKTEINIDNIDNVVFKEERGDVFLLKTLELAIEHSYSETEDIRQSDSEDDVPLTRIKSEAEQTKKKRVRGRKEKINKGDNDTTLPVILLTKEQQIANLLAKAKSVNYTSSPFRCEQCYRGFVDSRAYDNHKLKHDVRSGSYICDICCMRYRTPRHLRTHAINSHARIYKCDKCGHVAHTANQAKVHEKWHNGHTYECQLCSHKFRKPTSYLSHMRKHHPTEHVCNICGENFVGKHGLLMHKSKTHRDEKVENSKDPKLEKYCSDCNIQFCSQDAWSRHILTSINHKLKNDNNTQCMICSWRYTGNVTLATHMMEHERSLRQTRRPTLVDKHLRCQQCGANFAVRSKLQAHINRIHLGLKYNKNIVCEVCGKKCTSNASLKYHQRTHTGEKPYCCLICSKHFSDSNQLKIHTRIHTGEKPYVCAACGKRFCQKPALNRHYRVHTGAKPYTCQYCSRAFSQSNSLKLHVRTVHLKQPANSRKKNQVDVEKNVDKNTQDALTV
ncbi:unnamed protein product [Chrysodeixis includens]|uniref:Uncharacterized protein n=1 Tax=Chrysodeixis includens TaxID=689277 RepID=A0A9P0FYL1_CHRIL|nr:unnamed protein product [Chrysodeixis includens]